MRVVTCAHISVDSCSLDGCLSCQDEHGKIIRWLNKESSKDSLLTSFSFCHCRKHKLNLHQFHWRIWHLQRVLINVQLHSPCFHFAKVDNLNSRGFLKPNSMLVLTFFFLNSDLIIHSHITQKAAIYFSFHLFSVVGFD